MRRAYVALSMLVSGCLGSDEQCNFEYGPCTPPSVLWVFVNSLHGNGLAVNDPSGGTPDPARIDGSDLAYGARLDVGACQTDADCPTIGGEKLTCEEHEMFRQVGRVCVNAASASPGIRDAIIVHPRLHVVLNELVVPSSVTSYLCASRTQYTADPFCADCPEDPATVGFEERGLCLDEDVDGDWDVPGLLPGIARLECGSFVWTNVEREGYYDESGNLYVTMDYGFDRLGPRLVLTPEVTLPADVDCELSVSGQIVNTRGALLVPPTSPIRFHTQASAL